MIETSDWIASAALLVSILSSLSLLRERRAGISVFVIPVEEVAGKYSPSDKKKNYRSREIALVIANRSSKDKCIVGIELKKRIGKYKWLPEKSLFHCKKDWPWICFSADRLIFVNETAVDLGDVERISIVVIYADGKREEKYARLGI